MLTAVAWLIAAFASRCAPIRIVAVVTCPFVRSRPRRDAGHDDVRLVLQASIITGG